MFCDDVDKNLLTSDVTPTEETIVYASECIRQPYDLIETSELTKILQLFRFYISPYSY